MLEIYFKPLSSEDIGEIIQKAVKKIEFEIDELSINTIKNMQTTEENPST